MELEIGPVTEAELKRLLPLIADYQRFYDNPAPDDERNARFFRRFLEPSEDGLLLGARRGQDLVGYACLYWTFSSLRPAEIVLMNDLYVVDSERGSGVGRRLIEAATEVARARGAAALTWATAIDNRRAQRLYESTGAGRSSWFEYEIELDEEL